MKFLIIPASEVQSGDVIFTNNGDGKDVQFCGRVIGETVPRPHPDVTEWRVEILVGNDPTGQHTQIGFRHSTMVGVAREDEFVEVDVASILASLDGEDDG